MCKILNERQWQKGSVPHLKAHLSELPDERRRAHSFLSSVFSHIQHARPILAHRVSFACAVFANRNRVLRPSDHDKLDALDLSYRGSRQCSKCQLFSLLEQGVAGEGSGFHIRTSYRRRLVLQQAKNGLVAVLVQVR
jgi:hypothetical protein